MHSRCIGAVLYGLISGFRDRSGVRIQIGAYTKTHMHLLCITYRGQLRCFTHQGFSWWYSKCSEWVSTLFVFWQFSPNLMTPDLSQNSEINVYITTPMHLVCVTYRGQVRCFTPQGCFWSHLKCFEWVSTLFVLWQFSPNFMTPDLSQNPEIGAYITTPMHLLCITYHGQLRCLTDQGCFLSYSKCSAWV